MNNFGGNPGMQRRTAMIGGRGAPPNMGGGAQNPMANSFAANSNIGRGGAQPRIDGDFLSESHDDRPFGPGPQQNNFGGYQQRSASNQGSYNDNPYGNRPSTGNFPGGGGGGGGGRFGGGGGGPNNMSRTQGSGFGLGANRASNFSGSRAGGAGGAYNQPFQADSGLNRYGSQQSLAQFSQNSYGDQGAYGGRGGGNFNQFGRTAGPGMFRQPTLPKRQNSVSGGFGGGQRSFGQTFQTRQQSSGLGQYNQAREQVKNMYHTDGNFANLLDHIGGVVNQTKRNQQMRSATEFFKEFDAYRNRAFEEWELELMFGLNPGEASPIMDLLGDLNTNTVSIANLFECLYINVESLNIDEINRQARSAWDEKRRRLDQNKTELFVNIANALKESFGGYDKLYTEAFQSIQQQYEQDNRIPGFLVSESLSNAIADVYQDVQRSIFDFLNFIVLGRNTDYVSLLCFVRSLQTLSPDSATRSATPDNLAGASVDHISGFGAMEPANLEEMLAVIPEGGQVHNLIKILGDHLQSTGDLTKLDASFPSTTKMSVKQGVSSVGEANCAKKSELQAYLKSQVVDTDGLKRPLFEQAQINVILDLYTAEMPVAQVAAPAPQMMEAIPEAPENVLSQRDGQEAAGTDKVKEESKGVADPAAAKKEDSEFERDEDASQNIVAQTEKPKKEAPKPEAEAPKPVEEIKAEPAKEEKAAEKSVESAKAGAGEEMKEGGEPEFYEGGASEWINLDKFKADLNEAITLTRSAAKEVIHKIFEQIKKWFTLTKKSIKLMFRNQDKKRKKVVNKKQLYNVLIKVYQNTKTSLNQQIVAILTVMGDIKNETLAYERLTNAFFVYANEKMCPEFDPLALVVQNVREFADGKSLVSLLTQVDSKRVADENYRFEVPFRTMIQKISRHHGRQFTIDQKTQELLRQKIVLNKEKDMADLLCLQELMGFEEQALIDVQGNMYRRIAMELQMKLLTIEKIREQTIGRARGRAMMPQDQFLGNWFNANITEYKGDNDAEQFRGLMQEHNEGQANMVNGEKFIGKIEREMNKYALIQRFYMKLIKLVEGKTKQASVEIDDIIAYLTEKGFDSKTQSIPLDDFKELLQEMDLVGAKDENWDYFLEDFDADEEGCVNEDRFEEDMKEIVPHIEDVVFMIFDFMDKFCKNEFQKRSLKEEFMNIQRINQVQLLSARQESKKQIMWLHQFDFQRWFQTSVIPFVFQDPYGVARFDREVVNLFILYMESRRQKNMIYVPELLQRYIENFPDPRVEQEMAQESLILLIRFICKVLDETNKAPDEFFKSGVISRDQFLQILKGEPFLADVRCNIPTKLESVVRYSRDLQDHSGNFVDMVKWKNTLIEHIEKLMLRQRELLNIKKALDERGQTIEHALMTIKCTNDNIEELGIELSDMAQLCHMTEIKLDIQTVLEPILDTFDRNLYGEVAATDLINCIQTAHFGIFEEGDQQDALEATVNAKRYFQSVDQVVQAMCNDIEDREMSDFGSFLKGNDLFHEGKIRNECLFQILQKVFDEVVGEGDILDVIKMFDPRGDGFIQIRDVQRVFNAKIQQRQNRIKLVSWVDTCVEENIVEPVSPRSKAAKRGEETASMPDAYKKTMLMDIHCGALVKSEGSLFEWFNTYGVFQQGELNKNEFEIALERLGVESEIKEKEDVFSYMLKKVAVRDDKMTDFHKKPISHQSLSVSDLCDILNSDMPGMDSQIMHEKMLRMAALALTEFKVPILDGLKKFEEQDLLGLIDTNTFGVNVLENEFKLKQKMTRNMIQCLVSKYDNRVDTNFRYDTFIRDLESYEQANRAVVRIFKTQNEINFFNTTQKVDGDDNIDAESYKQNRVLVEPIKEPVYDSLTHKNTYYSPPLDEVSGNESGAMHNSFMENTGDMSFQGGRATSSKPSLDVTLHKYVDDLIVMTRRLGVSVEGYFQRFGKFSTQDGIRKIDLKQFTDAICNLSDSNWASQRSYLVTELFDAIVMAFENQNNRFAMNQTINSGPSHDNFGKEEGGAQKLTLQQIGKIAYHNSSVDLSKIEAETLMELHKVLFDNGLIDKLQDMVTFMNWARDSSCTISQFKNLLLDSMKVAGHISEERLELLLQRYRQDSYELAKIQRNDLAGLNSDRLEVIKQAFKNAGKQKIQILGCYHDLGYQQRKIGLKDQWACRVGEAIVKAYQVKLLEERNLPMTDNDADSQMHQFCLRMCTSSQEQFTFTDYGYMMTTLQLWDGQVYSRNKLENFFKVCQREELAEQHFFTPNTIDLASLSLPQFIPMQQFIKAFEFLARKPVSTMYQEILDKFYVISKRQHISISGPTIIHLFDYDDLEESGYVRLEVFVERIQDFLSRKHFKGNAVVTDFIHEADLRFLATKYMQRDSDGMVQYLSFVDDYGSIEQLGLGAGLNQLSLGSKNYKRDQALKSLAASSSTWRVKTIGELTPLESKQLYEKMGSYLQKKELVEPLCLNLVNADQTRNGFLPRRDISGVFNRISIKMSSKQINLLVQVLVMNHSDDYNYLEMIALLCGEGIMHRVMQENNLSFGQTTERPKKIDMSLLQISEGLKDQLELKLVVVQNYVSQLSRGSAVIRDQELFKIFKDAEIVPEMKDIDVLEEYLAFQRNQSNNTINFRVLLDHFKIMPETSNLLAEIVRQLSERKVVLEEVTSQRRFTFTEFKELLNRIGVKVAHSHAHILQELFFQMSERSEEVTRSVIVKCFGSQFTNIGKPISQSRKSKMALPEPPYSVNAFLTFLVNNKLNLRVIFAENVQSKRIKISQLREFVDTNRYQVSRGDFDTIAKFFAPPGAQKDSGRSSGRQAQNPPSGRLEAPDALDLGKIIVYARRIDPNYAKDEIAEGAGYQRRQGASKRVITSFPQRIKQILKRFSDYMIDNQIPKEMLFQELDKNNDGKITMDELVHFATQNRMIEGLQSDDVGKLFSFLDSNQNGNISINELCMLVEGVTLSMQARMASFSMEFEAKLKSEIEELFDRLDTNHNRSLSADELVQIVRPTDNAGSITLDKAYEIIKQFDSDGDGCISKPEFVNYLIPRQKRQILDFEGQMEDLRKLFKEQIAQGVAASPEDNSLTLLNKNQFISKDGLRNLIIKAGHSKVTQDEIDSIFKEMDSDQNGLIDIDEFMAFVQVADRVKTSNQLARDAVFNIRKARLKLNSLDLLEIFLKMPLSFLPSFSMQELENRKAHLPIHGIQFSFDHKTMQYKGLEKIRDLRAKQDQPKLYIAQYKPKVGLEIALTNEVFNVPLIQKLREQTELPHCEVRCCLFDLAQKVYLSNFYILSAEAQKKAPPKNKQTVEAQSSANWRFDKNLATFFLTTNQAENINVNLVIEFVIYGNNINERQDKSNQVTVGWTHVPIQKLQTTVKHKLELKGGNPFKEQEIITAEDTDRQPESKSIFKKIFGGGSDKAKVARYMTLDAKPFNKLPELTQFELSSLPSNSSCLVSKPLLSLTMTFRTHCYLLLTKHEQEMTQPQLDLVMVQFPKIYNSPDFLSALAECWPAASNPKSEVFSEERLELLASFVRQIFSLMFEPDVKLDQIYPTRSSPLHQSLYRSRQIALKRTLMKDNASFMTKVQAEILTDNTLKQNENDATIEPQDGETLFMEEYVPFTMGEICGNYDGYDGEDAISGLIVNKDNTVDEMERKYAADGLYI